MLETVCGGGDFLRALLVLSEDASRRRVCVVGGTFCVRCVWSCKMHVMPTRSPSLSLSRKNSCLILYCTLNEGPECLIFMMPTFLGRSLSTRVRTHTYIHTGTHARRHATWYSQDTIRSGTWKDVQESDADATQFPLNFGNVLIGGVFLGSGINTRCTASLIGLVSQKGNLPVILMRLLPWFWEVTSLPPVLGLLGQNCAFILSLVRQAVRGRGLQTYVYIYIYLSQSD